MIVRTRHVVTAAVAALGLGIGSTAWVTSSASAAPAAVRECTSGTLAVWLSPELGRVTLGTFHYPLDFTNIGSRTCYLVGWPGVSAINVAGKQLGEAAGRDSTAPRRFVNVAPGATAHAMLEYFDVEVNPGPKCRPVNAAFLRVYPPDSKTALPAFFDLPVCSAKGSGELEIQRVQPGVG
jgi:anti-sigma factor RsiW